MKRLILLLSLMTLLMGCTRTICVMTYNVGVTDFSDHYPVTAVLVIR